jgi:hypothetical protein
MKLLNSYSLWGGFHKREIWWGGAQKHNLATYDHSLTREKQQTQNN